MNFSFFTIEMKMYKAYLDSLDTIDKTIDDIIYKYAGVRAIQYDKQRMSFNKDIADETLDRMYQELKKPQKEKDRIEYAIKQLNDIVYVNLNNLPDDVRQMCIEVMWNNKSYEKVGDMFGYTASGLRKKMIREVNKI